MTGGAARRGWWLALAVAAAACVPYVSSIGDYFVQDDFGVVQLLAKRPWSTFPRWFVIPWMEDIWGYTPDELRPFVAFTYQLTGKWAPARPELHHLFNIAVHAGCALLVMAIARTAMGLSAAAAGFAGLVFAVLPNQVETVAWITGRVDSMPALFYFATFLAYAHWRQHYRWPVYAAALALFFVALFSKQNTITMVGTLAAYDAVVLTRRERGPLLRAVLYWAPFAVLTGGFLLLRRALFGQSLRPGLQTQDQIAAVATMMDHHVRRTMTGRPTGSRASGRLRAEGKVPGTVYGLQKDPASVSVVWRDLRHVLTGEAGLNALIDLEISGSTELVIVKEMQRHPVRRDVLHVDFLRVSRDQEITVEVPVVLHGEATEVLTHDGQVDQALYHLAISAKPADIPNEIGIDISGLKIGDAIRVGDVELPPGVTTEADPEDAIVSASVSQEADLGEIAEAEEAEEGAEGEEGAEAPSAEGDDSSGE